MKKTFGRIFCGVALTLLALTGRAQDQTATPERWLFIFDTSSEMKKRTRAEDETLRNMLVMSFNQQLHAGDSMAAWAFGEKLHAGDFPLTTWQPQFAAQISSNFVAFINKQHYSGKTTFATLPAALNAVIQDSERLTILIFCDGEGQINWSPYANGINQAFASTHAERKKSKQPIVILMRTQNGEFVGGAVSFPPATVKLPVFPPLPEPEEVMTNSPPPPPVIAPKPVLTLPSLIIVGTNVSTNGLPPPLPAPKPNVVEATNPAATHSMNSADENISPTTNFSLTSTSGATNTNSTAGAILIQPPTPAQPADNGTKILLFVGGGLFVAAIALVIFFAALARRRPRGSLISSSMQNDSRPRK